MRIEKKRNFSSISELEERAFCEGYMYAQREFAKGEADAAVLAERLNRDEYERKMNKRKKKRIGGHVMGALGTAGLLSNGIRYSNIKGVEKGDIEILKQTPEYAWAPKEAQEKAVKVTKNQYRPAKLVPAALGLGAAALTAGGLYRINKKANKNMTYEDWLAEKNAKNED